jgi:DNA-binding transcriptional LysR family regulator
MTPTTRVGVCSPPTTHSFGIDESSTPSTELRVALTESGWRPVEKGKAVDHEAQTHFYALADKLSLNMAARRCGVSRQAILNSLSDIECQYGAKLCRLEGKRPILTTAGRRLRDSLREAGIDESNDETICIMDDSFSEHQTTRWIAASAVQLWPSIDVKLLQGNYQAALADPGDDYFDLAFVFGWPRLRHPDWECTKLYDQEINAFLPQQIFNSEDLTVSLKALSRYTHLVPSEAMPGLSDLLLWESRRSGCRPPMKTIINKRTFFSLILAGRGVGFAPANSFQSLPSGVIRVPFESRITIPFVAIHRKHEPARVVHRMLNLACRLTDADGAEENTAGLPIKEHHAYPSSAIHRRTHLKKPRKRSMSDRAAINPTGSSDLLQPSVPSAEFSPIS